MIFLQETKCFSKTMGSITKKLGKRMDHLEIESSGMEGGLAIFWNPQVL